MKKTVMLVAGVLFLALTLTACATFNVPVSATDNPLGSRMGVASGKTYFFIFGDASNASIHQAARNGGITKISVVDYKVENYLNCVQTYTCIVRGE